MDRSMGVHDSDESNRRNDNAFKYMNMYHATLSEKLYAELCSFAFGEFDIEGGQISPIMWTRLHDIFSQTEIQTRKLPSDAKYSVSSQRVASQAVQIASVMAIFTALPHEYASANENSLLRRLVIEDIEFRRIFALLLWSEKAISEKQYEDGIAANVRKLEQMRASRSNSIMALKRSKLGVSQKDASVDPDSPGTVEDMSTEQSAMTIMFELVKCGEIAKAAELAMKLGMGPLAAQLQLHAMLRQPDDIVSNYDFENQGHQKRVRRSKYFTMMNKLVNASKQNEDDAHLTLLHALCGNLSPMLRVAKTVAEKVWAHANSAFIARLLSAEGVMPDDEIYRLFNVPLTSTSILEEIQSQNEANEVTILLPTINALLNEEIDDVLSIGRRNVEGYVPMDINCNVNVMTFDLFFHLIAIAYLSDYEINEDGHFVLRIQFDDLKYRVGAASHKRMAAFYSRFLLPEERESNIIQIMRLVDEESERIIFAESLNQCNIDFGAHACSLILEIRKEDEDNVITLSEQINHWKWLLIGGEQTSVAALDELNRLIRKCLLVEPSDEESVRFLIREALRFELPMLVASAIEKDMEVMSLHNNEAKMVQFSTDEYMSEMIEHEVNEFLAHCTFMDLYNFVVTIALKLDMNLNYDPIKEDEIREVVGGQKSDKESNKYDWEASLRVRARAELTLREEMNRRRTIDRRARNCMVMQHIEDSMPLLRSLLTNIGWRSEYFLAPRDNGDPMRIHRNELAKIRNRYVPQFFIVFGQACSKLNEMLKFTAFFSSFDVENGELGIDSNKISEIFGILANLNMDTSS